MDCKKFLSTDRPSHCIRHGKEQHRKNPAYDWKKSIISASSPRIPEKYRRKTNTTSNESIQLPDTSEEADAEQLPGEK